MFNFLASQHRQLPDTDLYDEEEDEVLLKSSRFGYVGFFPPKPHLSMELKKKIQVEHLGIFYLFIYFLL